MADTKPTTIYEIIGAIANEAGALAKVNESSGVPFAFRGIDAVINHLAPKLDEYGVFQTADVKQLVTTTRELSGGKAITQSDIVVEYTFYAPDGSSITTQAAGLAQDYADRSAAQAQSVALRTALLQLFHLPTTDKEPEVAGEETQRYIEKNEAEATPKAPKEDASSVRAEMGNLISNSGDPDKFSVVANQVMEEIAPGKTPAEWTLTHLKKGRDVLAKRIADATKGS